MSLAKLTALSSQTLSLLLERQRLQTLSSPKAATGTTSPTTPSNSLHLPQITRNLRQFRTGIVELDGKDGRSEAVELLRDQYERMRNMLGVDGQDLERLEEPAKPIAMTSTPDSVPPSFTSPQPAVPLKDSEPVYARYKDDPEAGYGEPGIMLQTQRLMMDEQDGHLDRLSHSINRQRDISVQINDELNVHTDLLEELDTDLDRTEGRLSGARRRLERVARGAKENGSTVIIVVLILILLILIIVFKT